MVSLLTGGRVALFPQRADFFYRQGHRAEVCVYPAGKDVGAVTVKNGADPAVGFWKKGGLHQAGF